MRQGWAIVAVFTVLVVGWLLLILTADSVRFVIANTTAKMGLEVFLAAGLLFAALVLLLAPEGEAASRMRWVASGFFVVGTGSLVLGYLYPVLDESPRFNVIMYGSLYMRTCGVTLVAVGLAATNLPRVNGRRIVGLSVLLGALGLVVMASAGKWMPLVDLSDLAPVAVRNAAGGSVDISPLHLTQFQRDVLESEAIFPGLTGWHWALSLIPLAVGIVAVRGAMRQFSKGLAGVWLLLAVLFMAGTQLHALFWPSFYSSLLTTTSVLRFGTALTVIVGGIHEFRRVVDDRSRMLSDEQERVRQLEELSRLKADFSSMVAHEIASPLAAIARMSEMIGVGALSSDRSAEVARRIEAEARHVQLLMADVRATAEIERDDFRVRLRVISIDSLLDEAEAHARFRDDTHPLRVERLPGIQVLADPLRIGQVLRNLLSNAMRHTDAGTPITLSASHADGKVMISVLDQGRGISPDDRARIFEKFQRGADTIDRNVRGRGLGLYLSRRIVRAHGSDLQVDSMPGEYTRFWFTLEVAK